MHFRPRTQISQTRDLIKSVVHIDQNHFLYQVFQRNVSAKRDIVVCKYTPALRHQNRLHLLSPSVYAFRMFPTTLYIQWMTKTPLLLIQARFNCFVALVTRVGQREAKAGGYRAKSWLCDIIIYPSIIRSQSLSQP